MPDIDLEPHEYRSQRTRRNANVHLLMAGAGALFLLYIWWNRADLTVETLFAATAMCGGFTGAGLIVFFNQFKGVQ